MVVAVYADVTSYHRGDAYEYFIKNLVSHLAKLHRQDEFYFIHHQAMDEFERSANLHLVCLPIKSGFVSKYFISRQILSAIKKIKAEGLICIDRIINTKLQQTVVLTRLSEKAKFKADLLERLNAVFTLSQSLKSGLSNKFNVNSEKIKVVYGAPVSKWPMSDEVRTTLKEKFADGKEYFLFRGRLAGDENIITVLKAFSVFKKRQKSSMKLVLMAKTNETENELAKALSTYKFRSDVIIAQKNDERANAAAFALIQPYFTNSLAFVLDALQNNIPVLLDQHSPLAEIAADAALYFDASSVDDIADKLMLIYRDENLYHNLKQRGNEVATDHSWLQTVQPIRQSLQ